MDFECRMAPEVLNLGGPRMKFLDEPNRLCFVHIYLDSGFLIEVIQS